MNPFLSLDPEFGSRFCLTLLHSLWQAPLLFVAAEFSGSLHPERFDPLERRDLVGGTHRRPCRVSVDLPHDGRGSDRLRSDLFGGPPDLARPSPRRGSVTPSTEVQLEAAAERLSTAASTPMISPVRLSDLSPWFARTVFGRPGFGF